MPQKKIKDRLCHDCKGTQKDHKGSVCVPCRGEGVITHKDNRRLALYWQASMFKSQK